MKETNHDYQYCVMENPHDANLNGSWDSWDEYKKITLVLITEILKIMMIDIIMFLDMISIKKKTILIH